MKAIFVFYSHDGNTEHVARKIAQQLNADALKLEAKNPYPTGKISKFIWGGKSVVFNEKPKLAPYNFNPENYDVVILGTPVWAGTYTPPMATFLQENALAGKKVALVACHDGGGTDKCFGKFQQQLGQSSIIARLGLRQPLSNPQSSELENAILSFCEEVQKNAE